MNRKQSKSMGGGRPRLPAAWPLAAAGLLLSLAIAGPAAAQEPAPFKKEPGETQVYGTGYAATDDLGTSDAPGQRELYDGNAHDPQDGAIFDGVEDYDLYQGVRLDDKQRWAGTDYVHWEVKGATLLATGQVHDADPKQASIVSANAWGAQVANVRVTPADGPFGRIRAENRISFAYRYLVSGKAIAEASVQLDARVTDFKGKEHNFHLNAQAGEKVTTEDSKRTGMSKEDYAGSQLSIRLGTDKSGVQSTDVVSSRRTDYAEINASVQRRLAQAGGDNGSTPEVMVQEVVEGRTTLERHYEVFSTGSVRLRARAAQPGEVVGYEDDDRSKAAIRSGSALVRLDQFLVRNSLTLLKRGLQTLDENPPPPPDTNPPGGGPITPPNPPPPDNPEGGGAPTPGGDGDGSGGGGGGGTATPGATSDDTTDREHPHRRLRADVPGIAADGAAMPARFEIVQPHGLAGEPGSLPGRLRVVLAAPVERDVTFALAADPPGALDFAGRESLTISAGSTRETVPFHALERKTATVVLQPLDITGVPAPDVFELAADYRSVLDREEPVFFAAGPRQAWRPGHDVRVFGLEGHDAGPLTVGRLGFSGILTTDSVLTVTRSDPDGILGPLPATITIPAGQWLERIPLALNDVAGTALLRLTSGEHELEIRIDSVAQAWTDPGPLRVPAGAIADVALHLSYAEPGPRRIDVTPADAALVTANRPVVELDPGERQAWIPVHGVAPGATVLRLESDGLDALEIPVEVVPATVAFADHALRVDTLQGSRDGEIVLEAPDGVRITRLDVPAGALDFVEVLGVGTSRVKLVFLPGPDLPETLEMPIAFEAGIPPPYRIGILDTMEAGEQGVLGYTLEAS